MKNEEVPANIHSHARAPAIPSVIDKYMVYIRCKQKDGSVEYAPIALEAWELYLSGPIEHAAERTAVGPQAYHAVDQRGVLAVSAGPCRLIGMGGHGVVRLLTEQFGNAPHGQRPSRRRVVQTTRAVDAPGQFHELARARRPLRKTRTAVGLVDDRRKVIHHVHDGLLMRLSARCSFQCLMINEDKVRSGVIHDMFDYGYCNRFFLVAKIVKFQLHCHPFPENVGVHLAV